MRLIIEARLADGDSDTVNEGDGVLGLCHNKDVQPSRIQNDMDNLFIQ
jgi:hypothetical protein